MIQAHQPSTPAPAMNHSVTASVPESGSSSTPSSSENADTCMRVLGVQKKCQKPGGRVFMGTKHSQ